MPSNNTITRWECPVCGALRGQHKVTSDRCFTPPSPECVERTYVAVDALLSHPMFEGEGSIPKANVRHVIANALTGNEVGS